MPPSAREETRQGQCLRRIGSWTVSEVPAPGNAQLTTGWIQPSEETCDADCPHRACLATFFLPDRFHSISRLRAPAADALTARMQPASLFDLSGKTAVIIGGTGELCGAMAEALAAAGAHAVLAGRSEEKAGARLAKIRSSGGQGSFIPVEAAERSSLAELLATTLAAQGKVDILINGAGANSPTPFLEITDEEYERLFRINTTAVFMACQIFGRYFVENHIRASIINVGSMSGLLPLSRVFTYSMTKAAVHNLSRNLAREWAPHGIRVNTLVPGFFPAEQNRQVLNPERVGNILRHTPMQRFGSAGELAGATLLLASDQAGSFITGTELVVDGGYSAMTI